LAQAPQNPQEPRKPRAPQTLEPLLRSHPFFESLAPRCLALIAGRASNAVFPASGLLFREGTRADTCPALGMS
jgi:hypothetical protein